MLAINNFGLQVYFFIEAARVVSLKAGAAATKNEFKIVNKQRNFDCMLCSVLVRTCNTFPIKITKQRIPLEYSNSYRQSRRKLRPLQNYIMYRHHVKFRQELDACLFNKTLLNVENDINFTELANKPRLCSVLFS